MDRIVIAGDSQSKRGTQPYTFDVAKEGSNEVSYWVYSTVGGTPHLDGQYTVFGEVEEGLDVVEMIQSTATGRADRPVDDIEMRMVVIE